MTPFEVIDKIARGDVYVINVTFPEGLTIAEMAKIFERTGSGTARVVRRGGARIRRRSAISIRRRHDLEGYLFPETYALPRHTDAARLVRAMVTRFEKVFTPELRQAAAARDLTRPPGRDARVDRREGNGARPTSGRSSPRSTQRGCASACRCSAIRRSSTRSMQGRPLRRQHPQGRSVVRLAVQHLSLSRPAARTDRLARPRLARGGGAPGRRRLSCTSSAATTARTSSRARSRSTIGTFRSIRFSTSAIDGSDQWVSPMNTR